MNRKNRKRFNMDMPEDIFKAIKLIAIKKNLTMTKLVLRLIIEMLETEKKYE